MLFNNILSSAEQCRVAVIVTKDLEDVTVLS